MNDEEIKADEDFKDAECNEEKHFGISTANCRMSCTTGKGTHTIGYDRIALKLANAMARYALNLGDCQKTGFEKKTIARGACPSRGIRLRRDGEARRGLKDDRHFEKIKFGKVEGRLAMK
jgi:hypothetical protein